MTSPERILITGVAGYIGAQAAYCFLDAGWEVIGIDDLSVGSRDRVPAAVRFFPLSVASDQVATVLAEHPVQAVLHFAGRISVPDSVRDPALYHRVNHDKAKRLFETVSQAGIAAVVFSSTAAVYGEVGSAPVPEDHPTAPTSPYGDSKLRAEAALRHSRPGLDLRYVILRYFNVAGSDPLGRTGPRPGAQHLIKHVAEAATGARAEVTIHGTDLPTPDGTGVRDYIHVADLAEAHLAAVRYLLDGGASQVLNCGYGRGYSVREVIEAAQALAPKPFLAHEGPRRAGDISSMVADATRIRDLLGWQPRHADLASILSHAIDWELNWELKGGDLESGAPSARPLSETEDV